MLFERRSDGRERVRRAVCIRTNGNVTLLRVAPGAYSLKFVLGFDWDEDRRTFTYGVEAHAFDKALEFTERAEEHGTVYSKQSVTLNEVVNGNASTSSVSPADVQFDELLATTD